MALNVNGLFQPARLTLGAPFDLLLADVLTVGGGARAGLSLAEKASLLVTTVLAGCCALGYTIVVRTLWVTELPLLIQVASRSAVAALCHF